MRGLGRKCFYKPQNQVLSSVTMTVYCFYIILGHPHFLIVLQESSCWMKFSELLVNYIYELFLVHVCFFLSFFEDLVVARAFTNHASSWIPWHIHNQNFSNKSPSSSLLQSQRWNFKGINHNAANNRNHAIWSSMGAETC